MRVALVAASLFCLLPAGGILSAGSGLPFHTLACPFFPVPNPARPLERCNVRATSQTGPANENMLAMDPSDPLHLVVVAKDYNYSRNVPPSALPANVISVRATTFDGGLTWNEGYLQPLVPASGLLGAAGLGTSEEASDPVVAFAPDGSVVAVTLRNLDGLPVYRSTDGGITFARLGEAETSFGTDKEWIASDPVTGSLYVATDGGVGCGTCVVRSPDNGLTWTTPVPVNCCFYPNVAVGPAGAVYVAGYGYDASGIAHVMFQRSHDQGLTWSPPVNVATSLLYTDFAVPTRAFRTPQIVQMAASRVDGTVVVVWGDLPPAAALCDTVVTGFLCADLNDDVFAAVSHDRGATWSAPIRVNDDLTDAAFQFMPQVAISPNGQDVHVAWLDQRNDPTGLTAQVFYAHSPDGGVTWDPNLLLSDQPFLTTVSHHQSGVPFVGDYIGLQASNDRAVVSFPDTRYGRADIFVATVT